MRAVRSRGGARYSVPPAAGCALYSPHMCVHSRTDQRLTCLAGPRACPATSRPPTCARRASGRLCRRRSRLKCRRLVVSRRVRGASLALSPSVPPLVRCAHTPPRSPRPLPSILADVVASPLTVQGYKAASGTTAPGRHRHLFSYPFLPPRGLGPQTKEEDHAALLLRGREDTTPPSRCFVADAIGGPIAHSPLRCTRGPGRRTPLGALALAIAISHPAWLVFT